MTTNYLDDSVKQTEVFEGKVPTMYLDTKGNVTVAVGLEVPSVDFARGLPFYTRGMGEDTRATPQEITDTFDWVKSQKPGKLPKFYQAPEYSVFLQDADIDSLLRAVVTANDSRLAHHFPQYDAWPYSAKLAYLDMAYNLGFARLIAEYTRMNAAAEATMWQVCAAECGRGVNDPAFERRNAWTRQQFLAAYSEKMA
jgi:hypothetical protein